jgi:hypothetical protein
LLLLAATGTGEGTGLLVPVLASRLQLYKLQYCLY